MGFVPSKYQEAVFEFVRSGKGNAIIEAVAGSGKTSTIVKCMDFIPADKEVLFCAFNKHIVKELEGKVPKRIKVRTTHSLGFSAWGKAYEDISLDTSKIFNFTKKIFQWNSPFFDAARFANVERASIASDLRKLVSKCKLSGIVPGSFEDNSGEVEYFDAGSCEHLEDLYDLDYGLYQFEKSDPIKARITRNAIREMAEDILEKSVAEKILIDFDDMLYMPFIYNVQFPQFDFVFIDEAQDISYIQRRLLARMLRPDGRLVAVGDRRQCHPAGTLIEVSGKGAVPIEQITVGTSLVSYHDCFRGIKTQGRKVTATSKRDYKGDIITIAANNISVKVTPNHRIPTRLLKKEGWAVYLLEKNKTSRIGSCKLKYGTQFGPAARMRHERADRGWVLQVFENKEDSQIFETLTSLRFSIIENIFFEKGRLRNRLLKEIGDNSGNTQRCLEAFGRSYEYPLFDKTAGTHIGFYLYVTQACNLIDGFNEIRLFNGTRDGGGWHPVKISTARKNLEVYSLNVEPAEGGLHLYVANKILVHNSIYAFRGASHESMDDIKREFHCTELPLSICYRCGKNIVKEAKVLVPHIEWHETNIDGVVERQSFDVFEIDKVKKGDIFVCRFNAPITKLALALVRKQVPINVIGRDFYEGIVKIIEKQKAHNIDQLIEKLREWKLKEIEKATKNDKEYKIESIIEKFDVAMAFIDATDGAKTPQEVVNKIRSITTTNESESGVHPNCINLSTVHRVKGLEADNVYFLDEGSIPCRWAKKDYELKQEWNLKYVGVTRAKKQLRFVSTDQVLAALDVKPTFIVEHK